MEDHVSEPCSDVSRETPRTPDTARGVFALAQLTQAEAYVDWLAGAGTVRGLIGPREIPRLWERHVLNCALLAEVVPQGARVCDLGSGAGLPGLVLAIARPDVHVTLVEPLLRRTTFLDEVVDDLGLQARVSVVRARAEEHHGAARYDVVTSRAVAPLERLLGWSMPLVAPEGALVAMKGSSAEEEIETARPVWASMGCARPQVVVLGEDGSAAQTRVVKVVWKDPATVGLRTIGAKVGRRGRRAR